ncbi:4Fe-4S binding protein [Eggerthella sinensis]|uniref:Ferredoxin n=3 Tax=Eggerthella sinensis TaxID=242230 RepID=A0A3N0IZD8_9ACTN|nr:4Fe-4S binding protein [Eggerthella sinensis]RNM42359.1 ferredoxin [Eggerthella sinensis]
MKKKNSLRVRFLVMLAVLAVVAVGYFTAGGIGNLCGIGFGDITLLCPLGALLAMLAQKTAIPLAVISVIVVLLICIVLGKVFCAWACPVHFMSRLRKPRHGAADGLAHAPAPTRAPLHGAADDPAAPRASRAAQEEGIPGCSTQALRAAQEGVSPVSPCSTCASPCGKNSGIKLDSRHGILAAALGSTLIFGFPVFCLICPVGLTFATVLLGMRLFAFGEATWTIVAFVAIIAVEVLLLPKWCKRFCPLGALLSLFSGLNRTFQPQVNAETCLREGRGKACNLCEKACPEGINLHDIAAGETTLNDCSKCRACADVCPEGAITFPLLPKKTTASAVETIDADETPERG